MKRRRHTPQQIIRKLREAERLRGEGKTIPEAAKELGISEQTYHRWRNQYGWMKADDAKRLKELERENATLKRIGADKELEVVALQETRTKPGGPSPPAPGHRAARRPDRDTHPPPPPSTRSTTDRSIPRARRPTINAGARRTVNPTVVERHAGW
jgi:putative transposase